MDRYERTTHNPLEDLGAVKTGRSWVSLCYTAGIEEFRSPSGELWLIGHVAGHGYGAPWMGSVEDVARNGTGTEP